MLRLYTITKGSFVLPDGSKKGVGEPIELEDDVARTHAHQVELVSDPVEQPAGEDTGSDTGDDPGQLP